MAHFNPPPNWKWSHLPPGWKPPKDWRPGPEYPKAPAGWNFWVDDNGKATLGPHGYYKGTSTKGIVVVLAVVLLCCCGGIGAFADNSDDDEPSPSTSTSTTTTTRSSTSTKTGSTSTTTTTRSSSSTSSSSTPPPSTPRSSTSTSTPPPPATTSTPPPQPTSTSTPPPPPATEDPANPGVPFENCDAARAAGAAPVQKGQPGYGPHLDRDGDGVGCDT